MNLSKPAPSGSACNSVTSLTRRSGAMASAVLILSIALASCANLDFNASPEQTVLKRATQRWQALMAKDFEKAYSFAVPSYRQIRTADYYRSKRQATPVQWLKAEVLTVECHNETCAARIRLESKPMVPTQFKGTLQSGLDETWVFEDGQWWMLETL